jgi:ATP-dependent helicase/nuclease subunit A
MNREDERRDVVFHPEYGLGPVYVDLDARTKSNTLARLGLAKLIRRESLSEELRVLYVAMTRAKELLVLTGTVSDLAARLGRWAEAASFNELTLPVYYRRECVSFLDWLMPCLARHRDCVDLFADMESACAEIFNHPARFTVTVRTANGLRETDSLNTSAAFYSSATPAGRASSEYAHDDIFPSEAALLLVPKPYTHEAALNLPSKVSISELKRLFAPETSPDGAPLFTYEKLECDPPAFYESGRTINAPRMGTILHTVMEHIDLHNHRSRAAINGLIDELAGHNLLTPEEAAAVNRSFIERFVQSRLADRMRQARVLYREVPFVMGLSPQEVYPDSTAEDETILVHGIIDCYFEENGGIVLVDYKSDVVADSPAVWAESHRVQMGIYKKAVARATGREVREALLYSFALGDTVAIEL